MSVGGTTRRRSQPHGPNGVGLTTLNLGRPHMVKTGTTDDYRDTWTIGCVPQVCVGVWMGNTNNDPMVKVSSSLTAGKVWVEMMQALIERNRWEPAPWPLPEGIVVKPGPGGREEVFVEGQAQGGTLEMDWMRPE